MEFKLPELGENIESAEVAEIHVAEGDLIEAEQPVMELETEKAVVELPAPVAGRVTKIHVKVGDTVKVGQPVLTIDETAAPSEPKEQPAGEPTDVQTPVEAAPSAGVAAESAPPRPEIAPAAVSSTAVAEAVPEATPSAVGEPIIPPSPTAAESGDGREWPPPPAGPATRRLARELGVDLHRVTGTGPGGRITQEDVRAYVRRLAAQATTPAAGLVAAPLPDFTQWGPIERQRLSLLARTSAENLARAWQIVPHVTQHDAADITELEAARRRYVSAHPDQPKVTMTAVVIKALVAVLKEFPHFNASLDAEHGELVLKRYWHIGVAVDTPAGLVVPVIRDADRKSIVQIAGELADLADRARQRKLDLAQMQGATMTVTNLGGIGGTAFTPIVNWPEVAILGMSRSRTELRLEDGQPVERLLLPLSLSYDHRVINGADAARFLVRLCRLLADGFEMLAVC